MPIKAGPEFPESEVPIVHAKTFLGDKFLVRLLLIDFTLNFNIQSEMNYFTSNGFTRIKR